MRLEKKKTTATLLIAIFMISAFAVAIPVFAAPEVWVDDSYSSPSPPYYLTIQEGIDAVDVDGTVHILAGIYDEQVVITKSLTLAGVGDTTIIKPTVELTPTTSIPWIGGGTGTMSAIVSVETTGGTVTVKNLKIDGSVIPSKTTTWQGGLVYLETSGKVEGVTVIGSTTLPDRTAGIFAAALTNTASLEVTGCTVQFYNRAGIYALGGVFTADYHHNVINGPGAPIVTGVPNGMFFLDGETGSASYNVVTDLGYTGETYRSTGIGTYNAGVDIIFSHNEISNVQNAFALAKNTIGTTVEYNKIYDCHTGVKIESGSASNIIQYNFIHDNDFAIRCGDEMGAGNVAHYNNFINNDGPEFITDGETYVEAVCNIHPTYTLDASLNWWGDASGPNGEGFGTGDSVSTNVIFSPWLDSKYKTSQTTLGVDVQAAVEKISISVTPAEVTFDTSKPGEWSEKIVSVENLGTVIVDVTATLIDEIPEDFYTDNLKMSKGVDWVTVGSWSQSIGLGGNVGVYLQLTIPDPCAPGTKSAILVFWAEASGP